MVASAGGQASLIGSALGPYQVEGLVGRGAMGTVYLARDTRLNRRVALKVLLGSLARSKSVVRSFHLEAKAAAPLKHPNIVRVYTAGIENGTPFIAMEFVEGEPLDRFLRRKKRLGWQQALHIGGQVAQALDCAHDHGIVHCDVKPSNIMLDRKGNVRLTDFGIANIQSAGRGKGSSGIIGTPQYMSPEQCTGEAVQPASDLFSLGVTLHQMIAGKMPFTGESSMALIKSICTEDPPRLNKIVLDIPDDVARLVAYLMEKDPDDRPASARGVAKMVQRLHRQQGGMSAVPEALTEFIREEASPRPFAQITAAAAESASSRRTWLPDLAALMAWVRRFPWAVVGRVAAVGVLSVCALSIGPLVSTFERQREIADSPALEMTNFKEEVTGDLVTQLLVDGYRFERVSWLGRRPIVLVEARGLEGTLTEGSTGLFLVDPDARALTSLRPPTGPAMDADYWETQIAGLEFASISVTPPASTLHESILFQLDLDDRYTVTLAQRWNKAAPEAEVLYRAPRADMPGETESRARVVGIARAIVKPDGETMCLVLLDATGAYFLAERDVMGRPLERTGPKLTNAYISGNILPKSVRYSPNGKLIAYLRAWDATERELWVVSSAGGMVDGDLVATGVVGEEVAFNAAGTILAYNVVSRDRGEGNQVAVSYLDGPPRSIRLCPGWVSGMPWLPSGTHLLFEAEGERATNRLAQARGRLDPTRELGIQLWQVEIAEPHALEQLTSVGGGLERGYAVSPDGKRAVAIAADSALPSLVFIDLTKPPIQDGGKVVN